MKLPVDLAGLARFILSDRCQSIVILTGAGVSCSSGIPDFRSPGKWGLFLQVKFLYILNLLIFDPLIAILFVFPSDAILFISLFRRWNVRHSSTRSNNSNLRREGSYAKRPNSCGREVYVYAKFIAVLGSSEAVHTWNTVSKCHITLLNHLSEIMKQEKMEDLYPPGFRNVLQNVNIITWKRQKMESNFGP